MDRPRVLITRPIHRDAVDLLGALADVDDRRAADGVPRDELRAALADADALVCQLTDPIDAELIEAAPRLAIIANVAVGYDNIDVAAAAARGIAVTNTPDVLTEATADLAFALLLAAARRLPEAERFLRRGAWRSWAIDLLCGQQVHGATLGIVGLGRIGQAVARRARGFAMPVLYAQRTRLDAATEASLGARYAALDELLAAADFVSLHCPLTPATHHLIDAGALARMKPSAVLVNTARGPIVDEAALADALAAGRPGAAGLDVFEDEPVVHPGLLARENVALAPHLGSATVQTRRAMCLRAAENVAAVLRGERPRDPVGPGARDG